MATRLSKSAQSSACAANKKKCDCAVLPLLARKYFSEIPYNLEMEEFSR